MSGSRMVWVVWCVAWAAFWAVMFVVFGRLTDQAAALTALLVLASLAAVALPVGGERMEDCPVCHQPFPQANMGLHMSVRHGVNQHSVSQVPPPAR
jgi:hypothetical protein